MTSRSRTRLVPILVTFVLTLLLVLGGLALFAWTGAVDVAATSDYLPGAEWFFSTLAGNSVKRHAAAAVDAGEIVPPAEITQEMIRSGAAHYPAMCVSCHGAPGVERGEMGQGMKPEPPDIPHVASEMTGPEIFWVLKHGIRHTGMPAFGATHSDDELWGLTAFVEEMAEMTPAEYEELAGAAGGGHDHGGHDH